jgi:eukaryotic-like serine/threonine-protein kinase
MTPEQWLEVKEILAEALELPAGRRETLLDQRCRGRPELRRELEELLAAAAEEDGFLDREPPLPAPALAEGELLGPYRIERKLAEGGMGEVYQAFDARLERRVAIKVLPPHLSASPLAVKRFERETKALAALSHPNILTIFDVGREGGKSFAVTELLCGETLRERLARGPLPVAEALALAAPAARGLAAAHALGIVHRDLKPENLFLGNDGRLKVLDFGIAALRRPRRPGDPATQGLTAQGQIVGTAGYMSPEQAQAKGSDARSDVFSFGAVLYEMLAGAPAFPGANPMATMMAAVYHQPAPLAALCPAASARLVALVERCLAKDPKGRYGSAGELAAALAALGQEPASPWLTLAALRRKIFRRS